MSRLNLKVLLFALTIISLLGGCRAASNPPTTVPPAPVKDWSITVAWNYDFTNFVPCSATVTKGCISGFTWGYIQTGGAQVPLKTSLPSVCVTSATQPEACSDTANSTLGIGSVVFYAVANGVDNNGNAVVSNPANSPQSTVSIGNPVNVSGSFK